jgi:dolichyl-phosphate-mannose--protein O-mannosyl transferase
VLVLVAMITALVITAVRVRVRPAAPLAPPAPRLVGLGAAAATFGFLMLLWPFAGATRSFFTHGAWTLIPMAVAALIAIGTVVGLRRWSASPEWTGRHLLVATLGALLAHTAFGLVGHADTVADRLFLGGLIVLTGSLGVALARSPVTRSRAQR